MIGGGERAKEGRKTKKEAAYASTLRILHPGSRLKSFCLFLFPFGMPISRELRALKTYAKMLKILMNLIVIMTSRNDQGVSF